MSGGLARPAPRGPWGRIPPGSGPRAGGPTSPGASGNRPPNGGHPGGAHPRGAKQRRFFLQRRLFPHLPPRGGASRATGKTFIFGWVQPQMGGPGVQRGAFEPWPVEGGPGPGRWAWAPPHLGKPQGGGWRGIARGGRRGKSPFCPALLPGAKTPRRQAKWGAPGPKAAQKGVYSPRGGGRTAASPGAQKGPPRAVPGVGKKPRGKSSGPNPLLRENGAGEPPRPGKKGQPPGPWRKRLRAPKGTKHFGPDPIPAQNGRGERGPAM